MKCVRMMNCCNQTTFILSGALAQLKDLPARRYSRLRRHIRLHSASFCFARGDSVGFHVRGSRKIVGFFGACGIGCLKDRALRFVFRKG